MFIALNEISIQSRRFLARTINYMLKEMSPCTLLVTPLNGLLFHVLLHFTSKDRIEV
jgi:hypothetical protein